MTWRLPGSSLAVAILAASCSPSASTGGDMPCPGCAADLAAIPGADLAGADLAGGGPVPLVFSSDWHTATGNDEAACRDGTRWDNCYNWNRPVPDRVTVLPAAGLGFPADMANVLAIRYEQSTDIFSGVNKDTGWPLPPVGGVLAKRMYFRMSIAGADAGTHHPVQSAASAGSCPYAAEWVMAKGDKFEFQIATLRDGDCVANPAECHRWATTLDRDATYRVEERYERTGTNTWRLHARVLDAAGGALRTDRDFTCNLHNNHTLADAVTVSTPDPTCLQSELIVNQGVGDARGSDDAAHNRIYFGGFAVSLTDWCGPYRAGE